MKTFYLLFSTTLMIPRTVNGLTYKIKIFYSFNRMQQLIKKLYHQLVVRICHYVQQNAGFPYLMLIYSNSISNLQNIWWFWTRNKK